MKNCEFMNVIVKFLQLFTFDLDEMIDYLMTIFSSVLSSLALLFRIESRSWLFILKALLT